jgi:hypothetical protein
MFKKFYDDREIKNYMNEGAHEGKISCIFVIPEFMKIKVGLDEAGNTGEDNGRK